MRLALTTALLAILAVAFLFPKQGTARTWRVEQDGTGDWFTIHAGVEAAADGDTLLIGPGWYSDLYEYAEVSDLSLVAIAHWDEPKELFFVGISVDEVTIGPEEFIGLPSLTYGLVHAGASEQHFANLTFVNLRYAIASIGSGIWVDNCKIIECTSGIRLTHTQEGIVSNSSFSLSEFNSLAAGVSLRSTQNIVVENCEFYDMKVYLDGSPSSTIRGCKFDNVTRLSSASYWGSGGVFENNTLTGGYVSAEDYGTIIIQDNVFHQGPFNGKNIWVMSRFPHVEIYRNIFHGGSFCTIELTTWASITGSGNHIIKGTSEYSVILMYYSDTYPSTVDLRDNYWGTSDPDSIAAMIYDGNDDHAIKQTVQFEPFSAVPLDTEKKALGSFKSMFR